MPKNKKTKKEKVVPAKKETEVKNGDDELESESDDEEMEFEDLTAAPSSGILNTRPVWYPKAQSR